MLVIVGHGPGVIKGLGAWLDQQTVVRLKWAERPDAHNWGSRTDFVCGSNPSFWAQRREPLKGAEFWWLGEQSKYPKGWEETPGMRRASNDWFDYWAKFRRPDSDRNPKMSTGLRAIFCAVEFLQPAEIGLLGFDRVLHPEVPTSKWWHEPGKYQYAHDAYAEREAIMALGVKFTEV